MRLIGKLPSESDANTFTAWLLTQSIECHVEKEGDSGFEVWVKDEDGFETAKTGLAEFKADPKDPKYASAVAEARKIEEAEAVKRQKYKKNLQKASGATSQKGIFEAAPLTMVLVLISVVVAVLTEFGDLEKEDRAVARALQFVAVETPSPELLKSYVESPNNLDVRLASVYRGEFWRTVSPIFVHYGPIHLVFNMLWMVQLGRMIETRYGTLCLAMVVVFSAIFSNVLQGIVPMSVGGSAPVIVNNLMITRFGGMSGVVYALFGFIWFRMLYDPNSRLFLPQSTIIILIAYLFYCMLVPRTGGILGDSSVANWAHGGGIVMGMLLGLSPIGKRLGKS